MDFISASLQDVQAYGRDLLNNNRDNFDSFEAVSNFVVAQIYNDFQDEAGEKIFKLLRIFKMVDETSLPPEGQQAVPDSPQWLALTATIGSDPAWNNRLESTGHRLLPADAFETPMLKATFEQIGLNNNKRNFVREAGLMANYFHVEKAEGSPYIVEQEKFVKRHDIKSVIGIGSPFVDGSMYVMLGFTATLIDNEDAIKFSRLSPFIGTLLAYYKSQDYPTWTRTE